MKKGSKKTLKSLKTEAEAYFEKEEYSSSLTLCEEIKKRFPKNFYGYFGFIKSVTHNYKKYVSTECLKKLKKDFDIAYELCKKENKEAVKLNFEDYVNDCKEVENLKKYKRELTSKYFLKALSNDGISFINQNISTANSYNLDGKKIVGSYDLIKGVFLFLCLVFNIIYPNYLLFITIPFGIFGLITIYSFININFFDKKKLRSEKKYLSKIIKEANKKISKIRKDILLIEESIEFLNGQKKETLLKIPETFFSDIKKYSDDNEEETALKILEALTNNNIPAFTILIEEETSLNINDVILKIKPSIKDEDGDLIKFIKNKLSQRKNSQNEIIMMKKITPFNYVIIILLLMISIFSITILVNNFDEINFNSFICALITGVISMLVYNIASGKHGSFMDAFNDNLLLTIFNSSLVYNLVYMSITREFKFTYGFIQMPIIFMLVLIGFIALVSLLKYKNLINKLRGE